MAKTPGALDAQILIRIFMRTYFVGAAFNTRGLQTVGLALAMEPALKSLYPDPAERRMAWRRYLKIYNTHPLWTPFLVGVFLALESRIAKGEFPAAMLEQVKSTMVFTLSAVGDAFFGGAFTTFWALTTACLLAAGHAWIAFFVGAFFFAALNAFKLATFILGYRRGFAALSRVRNWGLVDWARRVKMVNAALLVVLWALVWPGGLNPAFWSAGVALTLACAFAAGRLRVNRELLVGFGILIGLFFLWTQV